MPGIINQFISWLYTRNLYGPRCSEYEPGCIVCEQWKHHDEMFGNEEIIKNENHS